MKRFVLMLSVVIFAMTCVIPMDAYSGEVDKIGKVVAVKHMMQGDDEIHVLAIDDPQNPFITCYLTTISTGQWFAMADPSNSSIACRLTGDLGNVNKSVNPAIFSQSKSVLSKELRIARFYDKKRNVMVYVSFVTKSIGGSVKHSMSVVPLQ